MEIELLCVSMVLSAIPVNRINISVDHYPNNIKLMDTEFYQTGKKNLFYWKQNILQTFRV